MASKGHTTPEPQPKYRGCPNCYYPLPRFGQYCSHCGQKYTDGRVTVMSLIRHFLADTFNLDAKIWRTLVALMIPGKLTKTFFEGKQQRYIRPLRLFFVFAVITIAAVNFFEAEFAEDFFLDLDGEFNKNINYSSFMERMDTTSLSLRADLPEIEYRILDSLHKRMAAGYKDSTELGVRLNFEDESEEISAFNIAKKDIAELPVDSILQKYEVTYFADKIILRQAIRLQKQGENFAAYMLNNTIWMMLLIMPVLALFLKLVYVRRAYYYVEHLIFSFHVHAFVFFVLTVLMLLDGSPLSSAQMENVWIGGLVLMALYFYKSLRNVYKQSRFKTILKFCILNVLYSFILIIGFVFTVLIGALLY